MTNLLESTPTGGAPTWLPTNGNSLVSEVSYPMTNTFASLSATKASETVDGRDTMYGHHRRRQREPPGSIRSTAVTINDSVGDQLSLGDEDFDHQPLTVTDQHLLSMCSEVEGLLHEQLLQPIIADKGIFRKRSVTHFCLGHLSQKVSHTLLSKASSAKGQSYTSV